LQKALEADGTQKLMTDIELPMVRVLTEMEWTGVRIDTEELAKMSRTLTDRVTALEQQCYDMAGVTFNIGSPMQVGEVLFSRLNIDPKAKKTKNGAWSTTEEILEKYRHDWPIVDLILEIRGLRKLLATYVDALPRLINPATGRIHTTYNQTVTATGRLSSANPNLQNIPIRTDEGREIRRAFIASPGNVILSADYSQIELRLMADISGDPVMVQAFLSGEDIHRATAAKIYHLPIEEVSDSQRRNAKTANFGIIYGISAFGLSERLGIPRSEAKALIEGYLKTYPRVAEYMNEAIQSARDNEYVSTVMGRKRYLPEINSRNAVVRGYAERNAINAPLQGSAADIIKIAMINIAREMKARGMKSRMITQVHDELVFDVVPAELEELTTLVTEKMQGAYKARVPLTVSAGTGDNWLEAH
jgi:DNA polymerase-1